MYQNAVALYLDQNIMYTDEWPCHPDKNYPELKKIFTVEFPLNPANKVYSAVREIFNILGMDSKNFGSNKWNPFSEIIKPGQTVLIKPNLVMHEMGQQVGCNAMHTHGSLIRAIADYALIALQGKGKLIVADSPLQGADFDKLTKETGLNELKNWYHKNGIEGFEFCDLRKEWARLSTSGGMTMERIALKGDPLGYCLVNLGKNSALEIVTKPETRFGITGYEDTTLLKNHKKGNHNYLVARSVLEADVILNLPKLKTHMKTGITACLKNLVGINGSKDFLPHYRLGSVKEGGDEFPEKNIANILFKKVRDALNERSPLLVWNVTRWLGLRFRRLYSRMFDRDGRDSWGIPTSMVYGGSWYGNDTAWRMVHDLNTILLFADKRGKIRESRQRKCFSLVDAIVAGEGEGPLSPSPKRCGLIIGGIDSLRIDIIAASIMGYDINKIPMLNGYSQTSFSDVSPGRDKIPLLSNINQIDSRLEGLFNFIPPQGWLNHIEL
jgi:uncharacterized protein (DUF362 family)